MSLNAGDQLGPVGARIVAETFVRILKRDASSILNIPGGFTPSLPGRELRLVHFRRSGELRRGDAAVGSFNASPARTSGSAKHETVSTAVALCASRRPRGVMAHMAKKKARKSSPMYYRRRTPHTRICRTSSWNRCSDRRRAPGRRRRRRWPRASGCGPSAWPRKRRRALSSRWPRPSVPRRWCPREKLPKEIQATQAAIKERGHRFHGGRINLAWFPWRRLVSPCADKFGYLTSKKIRNNTKLPFDASTMALLISSAS